jgi:pimeloyl-ACP methyl ester carboxylesterase
MECRVRDITVHYEEVGVGRPLVVLHGWPLDHRHVQNDFEPVFASHKGWRRIYPDLPGMGETKVADWITCQDHMLEVVSAFIDIVTAGERFVVAGASYGGYLARGLVFQRSELMDGLMINVPVVQTDPQKQNLPKHRVVHQDADFLAALTPEEQTDLPGIFVAQSMEVLETMRSLFAPAGVIADHNFLGRLQSNYAFSFDVDVLREPFSAPALFLTGRFDHWCGYREAYQLLDNYPRATFAVLDRAGHGLAMEQKHLFRALVGEWLDRVEEYSRQNSSEQQTTNL